MIRTERGVKFLVLASSLLLVGACIAYEGGGIYQRNRVIMHGSKSKMLGPAVLKAQEAAVSAASEGVAETNRDEPKSEEEPESGEL